MQVKFISGIFSFLGKGAYSLYFLAPIRGLGNATQLAKNPYVLYEKKTSNKVYLFLNTE